MKNRRFYQAVILLLLFRADVWSQNTGSNTLLTPEQFQSPIPPSPNAAAIAKYGEIPVGNYNGIPNITVPLYTIQSGKLQLPLILSYHAGGIRVEEAASWVGLGWSMSLPGAIVKQTRGLPDETTINGFETTYAEVLKFINNQMTDVEKGYFLWEVKQGHIDTEPDLYTYNINGLTGTFFFDYTDGNYKTIPLSTVKIERLTGGWSILDNTGILYTFTSSEISTSIPSNGIGEPGINTLTGVSSWNITQIKNLKAQQDEVNFEYESFTNGFITLSSQVRYILNTGNMSCPARTASSFFSSNSILSKRLVRITFKDGEILFHKASTARMDLPDDYALNEIEILNSKGSLTKKIQLSYYYTESDGISGVNTTLKPYYRRMILDKVTVNDGYGNSEGFYQFEYNSGSLPNRLSYDQDFWGYPNNAGNGSKFVPSTILQTTGSSLSPVNFSGANRLVNPLVAGNGLISKITYPTGGFTTFIFESNDAFTKKFYETSIRQGVAEVGTSIEESVYITYSPEFTLSAETASENGLVPCTVSYSNSGASEQSLDYPRIDIYSSNGYYAPLTSSGTIFLPPGTYYLRIEYFGITDVNLINGAHAVITFPLSKAVVIGETTYFNVLTGGQRIKEIKSYDQEGKLAGSKFYSYNSPGSNNSSGRLVNFPNYISNLIDIVSVDIGQSQQAIIACNYTSIASQSNYTLASTKGSTTGYGYVKELVGVNGDGGKNEYYFTTSDLYPDLADTEFPYPPSTSKDWLRGNLTKEVKYKKSGTSSSINWDPVYEKTIGYQENGLISRAGLKTGQRVFNPSVGADVSFFETKNYTISSSWFVPITVTVKIYDQASLSQFQSTTTDLTYTTSQQLKKAESESKKGKMINITRYPTEVEFNSGSGNLSDAIKGIYNLRNTNLINNPVEIYTVRKDATNSETVVAGRLYVYDADKPFPIRIYTFETSQPIPLSQFVPAYNNIQGGNVLVMDSHYQLALEYNYDNDGNIIYARKSDDISMSYLWDYKNQYPVAEVSNGLLTEIGYSSFEGESTGRWLGVVVGNIKTDQGAVTGLKSYQLDQNGLSVSGLPSKDRGYIVSYWSRGGTVAVNGSTSRTAGRKLTIAGVEWTYYQVAVASGVTSVTITGTGVIDELRLYPAAAMMTTYTYIPQVGVQSKCDVNNMISYYEYDKLGRLLLIRDDQRNIIKSFQYQYQVPVQ